MEWLKKLNEPELVVKFQKKFGVIPKHEPALITNYKTNGEVPNGTNHVDKKSNDVYEVSNGLIANGIRKGESYARLRNGVAGKTAENGHSPHIANGTHHPVEVEKMNAKIQNKFDTDEYQITNKFFYYLFHFGANLGNEIFYITFYPFWIWNIDGFVGRRVCIFWALFMYLGQATKDILKIPRPASPPVMRMEKLYALEYGMPSTHAMVGAGFPFTILFLTWQRYIYPAEYGVIVAVLWTSLVCCSRLYLGMHSVLDVLAGLVYVFTLMPVFLYSMDFLDEFILTSHWSPLFCTLVPIAMCLLYPKLDRWSTARGDTTTIVSCASGICVGTHVAHSLGILHAAQTPPPYEIIDFDIYWPVLVTLRLIIGVSILVLNRTVMKAVGLKLIQAVTGIDTSVQENRQRLCVEMPSKFITYFTLSLCSVLVVPSVFRFIGIERATYFTEM